MRRMIRGFVFLAIAGLVAACGSPQDAEEEVAVEQDGTDPFQGDDPLVLLVGHWSHHHELNTDAVQHWERDAVDLGPALFRGEMRLLPDGEAEWNVLAPDDGHYMTPATWSVTDDVLEIHVLEDETLMRFRVVMLEGAHMQLLRLQE